MNIQEGVSLKGKTTMRIGGTAKYYAELASRVDVEAAVAFAQEKNIPIIPLGGGSNTIFADGEINALVIRVTASQITNDQSLVTVEAGKNLPQLINELAEEGLDLSPLTGILGTVGGAIFGNAGQGANGIWIDNFVVSVDVYTEGTWKTFSRQACGFDYRESWFKAQASAQHPTPVIWSTTLSIPKRNPEEIKAEIERLLQKRIQTQPHVKTAGSCFKAVGDRPAWQLIDEAGLRNTKEGGVHISEKHANFLINDGDASFEDAKHVVNTIKESIPHDLDVEMRCINEDGSLEY